MSNNTVAGFRLSTQQERLWSQMTGKVSPFWAECELLVDGPLDAAKLQGIIRGIIIRHEILRTAFHRQTGLKVPFQVILETPGFAWETTDLTGLDESAQRQKIRNLVSNRDTKFDFEQGPALHVVLAVLAPQNHALVLSLPALCADLGTMQNLANELGRTYVDGFDETGEVMQYPDVAEWQQELLASDDTKPGRDYWRDYCRKIDFSALDSVLSAFERKSSGDFVPDVVVTQVEVSQLASRTNPTLQEFLLACWQVSLSRMTGRPGVTVGCQFEGRNYSELENSLGVLSRFLPLESVCSDATTFHDLLEQVQRDTADFRDWQDSFSWSNAGLPAGFEQGPMLPVAFDFAELPSTQVFEDLKLTVVAQEAFCERFRLKLSGRRQNDRVWLEFHFDSGSLDRSTVKRWSTHFLTLLAAAAADPGTLTSR